MCHDVRSSTVSPKGSFVREKVERNLGAGSCPCQWSTRKAKVEFLNDVCNNVTQNISITHARVTQKVFGFMRHGSNVPFFAEKPLITRVDANRISFVLIRCNTIRLSENACSHTHSISIIRVIDPNLALSSCKAVVTCTTVDDCRFVLPSGVITAGVVIVMQRRNQEPEQIGVLDAIYEQMLYLIIHLDYGFEFKPLCLPDTVTVFEIGDCQDQNEINGIHDCIRLRCATCLQSRFIDAASGVRRVSNYLFQTRARWLIGTKSISLVEINQLTTRVAICSNVTYSTTIRSPTHMSLDMTKLWEKSNGYTTGSFLKEMETLFVQLSTDSISDIWIIGEFNFHYRKDNDSAYLAFKELIQMLSLSQLVTNPTHRGGNILDLVITSAEERITALQSVIALNQVVSETLELHASMKTAKRKESTRKNWYDDEIHEERRKRRQMERKYRKTHLKVHKHMWNEQCQRVVTLINQKKVEYHNGRQQTADSRDVFKILNTLLTTENSIPIPTHSSEKDLAERFSEFFSNKIKKIRSELDQLIDQGVALMSPSYPSHLTEFRMLSEIVSLNCCREVNPRPAHSTQHQFSF
ncbi:hypothetical protein CAPTEDRAFT_215777 [Capitella teleta]|uniref:Endonuclease/exonuclease/phosphatase domain-containing protein n=1 Tax=Capitella teleta TaxID=283909 RepID=R7VB36_CAPTE|nr:hypothetical protein CAPTEDRAFT_215777 [Capitella teleta]|eukprot:ELU15829.1 hypothetical protein CAPTEDRAFT_215777 [Capitella teleta]